MGEIHELFVLALSLVWFAGATAEKIANLRFEAIRENRSKFRKIVSILFCESQGHLRF